MIGWKWQIRSFVYFALFCIDIWNVCKAQKQWATLPWPHDRLLLCISVLSQQLNAEVEFLVKSSELLVPKGTPTKERNERVSELVQVHQRVRDRIREYETLLGMAVKFHHVYQEVTSHVWHSQSFMMLRQGRVEVATLNPSLCLGS